MGDFFTFGERVGKTMMSSQSGGPKNERQQPVFNPKDLEDE